MKKLSFLFLLLSLFLLNTPIFSQCAMCKAVVESDMESGGTSALGINNGIIYLMIFPYILMGIVGYFIYKNYKKNISSSE